VAPRVDMLVVHPLKRVIEILKIITIQNNIAHIDIKPNYREDLPFITKQLQVSIYLKPEPNWIS
jgi:hypothetical protein